MVLYYYILRRLNSSHCLYYSIWISYCLTWQFNLLILLVAESSYIASQYACGLVCLCLYSKGRVILVGVELINVLWSLKLSQCRYIIINYCKIDSVDF